MEPAEEEALYVVLKAREERLRASHPAGADDPLRSLLMRLEKALFQRLTIEELEHLPDRFPA